MLCWLAVHWIMKQSRSKFVCFCVHEPGHDKTNKMSVRPAKIQISLGSHPVWSESSLCSQWVAKDPRLLHVDSEDSDLTGRMPRLIWVFAGRTLFCWFCHVAAHIYLMLFLVFVFVSHLMPWTVCGIELVQFLIIAFSSTFFLSTASFLSSSQWKMPQHNCNIAD